MMHSALANVETKSGKKLEQATSTQVTEPSIQVNEVVFSGNTIYTEQLLVFKLMKRLALLLRLKLIIMVLKVRANIEHYHILIS
ncbi:MAG: hypothetical protein KBC72_05980 [Acinetobacter sp.]|nr:hypothetical protein [Acinetobacter sp.]